MHLRPSQGVTEGGDAVVVDFGGAAGGGGASVVGRGGPVVVGGAAVTSTGGASNARPNLPRVGWLSVVVALLVQTDLTL